ncbi:MAG: YbaY family lipoprotein [Tateyamaria sp.]|uniref:YbaY family lipoprotein n=1 Tax=Tateyamaria sp. TaxID=1929288 RepID=UPI00326B3F13
MRALLFIFAVGLSITGGIVTAMETITVSATYRERIAMLPGVTFEAQLQDVSLADAPAKILGAVTVNDAGNPPYEVALPFNPDVIQDGRRYAVRASLRMGDKLLFTTDTHTPVLTNDTGTDALITMVKVQAQAEPTRRLIGEFVYFADAATFTACGSEETYPVAMEGAYLDAERAYRDAQAEPGAPTVVVFDGQIAEREGMEGGQRDMVVMDRLAGFVPGLTCERAMADSDIGDAYWRILSIGGETLGAVEGKREPHVIFRSGEGTFTSTIGCNTVNGGYALDGSSLTLQPGPMTLMACPPPLDEIERAWVQGIASVSEAIVTGPTMELRSAEGETVAFLENVALR